MTWINRVNTLPAHCLRLLHENTPPLALQTSHALKMPDCLLPTITEVADLLTSQRACRCWYR